MKIKHLVLICGILLGFKSFGQNQENIGLADIKTIQTVWGKKFVYKNQVIENPLALQIPLLEAKDPEVSYEFLTYKNQRKNGRLISGISTVVALYSFIERGKVSDGFYWSVVGGIAVVNIYIGTISTKHLNRALNRYNQLAKSEQKISLQLNQTSTKEVVAGLGWSYQF